MEVEFQGPEVALAVAARCCPLLAARCYQLPEAALAQAVRYYPPQAVRCCLGAEEPHHQELADGSEAKSQAGELLAAQSRREDAAALGQDARPRVFHSRDLPDRKEEQSDASVGRDYRPVRLDGLVYRVELGVILGQDDRGCLGQTAHGSNTKFRHVLTP